jgi:hypothetical protein
MAMRTDAELIKRIFPDPGNPAPELVEAWKEFIIRCQEIIIEAFNEINISPDYQPSLSDVYLILEKTTCHLYQASFRQLRSIKINSDFSLPKIIAPIAITFIYDLLASRKAGKPEANLPTPDESKKS